MIVGYKTKNFKSDGFVLEIEALDGRIREFLITLDPEKGVGSCQEKDGEIVVNPTEENIIPNTFYCPICNSKEYGKKLESPVRFGGENAVDYYFCKICKFIFRDLQYFSRK